MPRPKLIDDSRLMQLYQKGMTLKEIGRELNVSSVAAHKRIKKLALSRMPDSLERLTDKRRDFALAVASGQSRTGAAMQVYDVSSRESAKALQTTLMKDPEIRTAIDDLMEISGIGRQYRVEKLKQHLEHSDPSISLKSLDIGFKLANDYPPQKNLNMNIGVNISPVDMTKYLLPRKEE